MEPGRVIFVSAVSNEFHTAPPQARQRFHSYRDVLKQAFRALSRDQYEVIVQEDLLLGPSDLLATLDHEVERRLLVIHLVGELAGFAPEPAPLRALQQRHPDLLERVPELREALAQGSAINYTQWELYLAFYHGRGHLIFQLQPDAPALAGIYDSQPSRCGLPGGPPPAHQGPGRPPQQAREGSRGRGAQSHDLVPALAGRSQNRSV
jgi:hypothetical protein